MIIGGSCAFFLPDDRSGHSLSEIENDTENDDLNKINLRANMLTPDPGSVSGTGTVTGSPEMNPILEFSFKNRGDKIKEKMKNKKSSEPPYSSLPLEMNDPSVL